MPAPRALTPEQRQQLHAWFKSGCGERAATRKAQEAGWKVGHTTIGAELRLWRAGAGSGGGGGSPGPAIPEDLTVVDAKRRALRVLLGLAEDTGVEARVRVDASRAILRDGAVEDDGEPPPAAAGAKPFIVEARN